MNSVYNNGNEKYNKIIECNAIKYIWDSSQDFETKTTVTMVFY